MLRKDKKEIDEKVKCCIVEAFIGEELEEFVEKNLGMDWKMVLRGEITPYVQKLIDQSFYFDFQKQGRDDLEFLRELIYSRCIELKIADNWCDRLVLDGSDKDCLITRYVNHRSDFKEIDKNNYYEVVSNYNGHFKHLQSLYLPARKAEALMKNAKKNHQYVIAVDVMFKVYYIVPILAEEKDMSYLRKSTPDGGYWLGLRGMKCIKLGEEDVMSGSIC